MILQLTQWILDAIRTHGAWSVFLGVLIEQVIIPIPSPAIIMGAGLIMVPVSDPWVSALATITWKIVLPGTVASTMGAALCYYIALWGGKVFVERFHGYLGFSWGDIERMSHRMRTSGVAATIFFMRALPIVPLSLVSMVCGVADVPSRTFLVWTVLGTIPRCYILGILGWQLGSSAMAWARGVNRFESVISLTIVLAVFGGIFYLRRRLRKDVQEG